MYEYEERERPHHIPLSFRTNKVKTGREIQIRVESISMKGALNVEMCVKENLYEKIRNRMSIRCIRGDSLVELDKSLRAIEGLPGPFNQLSFL